MSTLRYAVATAIGLVLIAVVARLVLFVITPLFPVLFVGLFFVVVLGILLRGR